MPSPALALSLKFSDPIVEQSADMVALRSFEGPPLVFRKLTPAMVAMFNQLAAGNVTEQELSSGVMAQEGTGGLILFYQYLHALGEYSLLCHTLRLGERPLLTIRPIARHYRFASKGIEADSQYLLSRFAYLHTEGAHFVLECPLGYAKLIWHDAQVTAVLQQLATAQTLASLTTLLPEWDEETLAHCLNFLHNAKALVKLSPEATNPEETLPTLSQWEFHDLLFHSRSRLGRHENPYGGNFRFAGKFPPLPLVKPVTTDVVIPLYKPDMDALKVTDTPFTAVLEKRRSIRDYAETPLTAEQLGEFLYRTSRFTQTFTSHDMEVGLRPYAAGGAIHEVEIYPVVDQCTGLEPAVYHYNPKAHQLEKVTDKNRYVDTLLLLAWITANRQSKPQIYFALTARFQRFQWKYQSMVYAAVLKHVGVIYQTMYLVATAMNIAPCALGGGDSELFATATGIDYYAESLVGEFVLGSKGAVDYAKQPST